MIPLALQLHSVIPLLPHVQTLVALLEEDQRPRLGGHHRRLAAVSFAVFPGAPISLGPPSGFARLVHRFSPEPGLPLLLLPFPAVLHVRVDRPHLKNFLLHRGDLLHEDLEVLVHQLAVLVEVTLHGRQNLLVYVQHVVQGALRNVESREGRQEIVSDEHADKNNIVYRFLQVVPALIQLEFPELSPQTLSQKTDVQESEALGARVLKDLPGGPPPPPRAIAHLLSQQKEVGLVRHQSKHDEVGVQTVQAVLLVRLVVWVLLRPSEVLHHLVLALSRHEGARQDDLGLLPKRVL
mmetsp:Transcript_14576/g.41609  ORF Transcript_14576/g.41609 Transcript_14576/m.41609 type:complete len:294 (+) Transcript_14576:2513-3394(+)